MSRIQSTAARIISVLRQGPAALKPHAPTIAGVSDEDAEVIRLEIRNAYRRWLETFVVPDLQAMIPEVRQ